MNFKFVRKYKEEEKPSAMEILVSDVDYEVRSEAGSA